MTDMKFFAAKDGTQLAYQDLGTGDPLILLHGLFSTSEMNWVKFGTTQKLVDAGYRVILPDLRAHGQSDAPQDEQFYGPDILADDLADLVAHLDFQSFDLGGFSLGSRTSVRAIVRGMKPRRLILGGMGLAGLAGWSRRSDFFKRAIAGFETAQRGDDIWLSVQFMKSMKVDRIAAGHLLDTFTDTSPDALSAITMPTLVVCGEQDQDNGKAGELADHLPKATLATIPGTHMSSVTMPELGDEILKFLEETPAA